MDRITALRARRAAGLDEMTALVAGAEDREFTAEEQARYDALKAEDDKLVALIAREEDMERRRAAAARPVPPLPGGPAPAPTVPAQARAAEDRGVEFGRIIRAMAGAAAAAKAGNPISAADFARVTWGDDQVAGLLANQNMSTGSAGGFLVPESVSAEIIELLRPASVVMSLNPVRMPMPSGSMSIPRLATGASASYIGEQNNAPATGVTFGAVRLSAKKLAALIPVSNDLIRAASVQADRVVRDDMVAAIAQRMDLAFIRGAGSEFAPRGLRFQLTGSSFATTHILTMTGSPTLATVTTDLGRLRRALRGADVPMLRCGWIMSPRTEQFLMDLRDGNGNFAFRTSMEERGLLSGYPYRVTTQIPENLGGGTNESELYFADFAQVLVGEFMGIEVATSTEAAYRDSGNNLQAAFSRDETVMRGIAQHDIGLRHLPAMAVLTGVTWGA